jgi:hypothetical protein
MAVSSVWRDGVHGSLEHLGKRVLSHRVHERGGEGGILSSFSSPPHLFYFFVPSEGDSGSVGISLSVVSTARGPMPALHDSGFAI